MLLSPATTEATSLIPQLSLKPSDKVNDCKPLADGSKLNAAGREDMDVRMLGGGRPFILEVHNPRSAAPTSEQCAAMELELERADDGAVTARGLHVTDHSCYHKMHEVRLYELNPVVSHRLEAAWSHSLIP
jgi:tRNA U54 and U55 pseudouridine synthase Pus10